MEKTEKIYNWLVNEALKKFYTLLFPIILAAIFLVVYYSVCKNIIFLAAVYIVLIILWIIKLSYIPKNKKGKNGVIIYIDKEIFHNENEYNYVKKLRYNLKHKFNIIIAIKNPFINLDNPKKKAKILNNKKCYMMIDSFAFEGKDNSDNIYCIDNSEITIKTPIINQGVIEALKKDFTHGFYKLIKLSNKNSVSDINFNAEIMASSIQYFSAIIYILFGFFNEAEAILDSINITDNSINTKVSRYLINSVDKRKMEINLNKIAIISNTNEYLTNPDIFNYFVSLLNNMQKYKSYISNNKDLNYQILALEAIVLYKRNRLYEAKGKLKKMNLIFPKLYVHKLSEAFISVIECEYSKSLKIYKRVFNNNGLNDDILKVCYDFLIKEYAITNNKSILFSIALFDFLYFKNKNGQEKLAEFYTYYNNSSLKNEVKLVIEPKGKSNL